MNLLYVDSSLLLNPNNGGVLDVYFISFLEDICIKTNSKIVIIGSKAFQRFFSKDIVLFDDRLEKLMKEFDILGRNKGWVVDSHNNYLIENKLFNTSKDKALFVSRNNCSDYVRCYTMNSGMDYSNHISENFGILSYDFRENITIDTIVNKLDKFYNND